MIKIILVDDHVLLRTGLASLINSFGEFNVIGQADNGKEFLQLIADGLMPDIILLDISMPIMDGFETAKWIKINFPQIKILVLSMLDNELPVIRMIKLGAKGYLLKDSEPAELKAALLSIVHKGYFANELVTSKLINTFENYDAEENHFNNTIAQLNEKETAILKLFATDLTTKEIALEMETSARTIEHYRDMLCGKFKVRGRIGLVVFAVKHQILDW